jgi:O-antigen/teichoic acid export membrane protein
MLRNEFESLRRLASAPMQKLNASKTGGRLVISIAFSKFTTSVLTAGLGFVFWTVAARLTSAQVVGRSAAAISAMQLIATFCALGFPALMVAELRDYSASAARRLVVASLAVSGGVAYVVALIYGVCYHLGTNSNDPLYGTVTGLALFGAGAAITTVVWVVDGALIGVQRSWAQVTRNLIFAVVKLAALPVAAWAAGLSIQAVYFAWLLGNLASLVVLVFRTRSGGREWARTKPSFRGLARIWRTAASHHWVSVALQIPHLAMPIMVSMQLGAATNAAFYAALLIVVFVWTVPGLLGVGLFAVRSDNASDFRNGLDTAIRLASWLSIAAAVGAPFLAHPFLKLFGSDYTEATLCLIILTTCTFASAAKSIYIGVRRMQRKLGKAARTACIGSALELGAVEIGICMGSLTAIGFTLGAAMVLQAVCFWPIISRARQATNAA